MVDRTRMLAQLILHEGFRAKAYLDTDDPPNWTIGIGYDVTARGWVFFEDHCGRRLTPSSGDPSKVVVTLAEASAVAMADVDRIQGAIPQWLPDFEAYAEPRQRAMVDLAYTLGYRALGFVKTLAAIKDRDWSRAAKELYRSKLALNAPTRTDRLARMILTAHDYTA